MAIEKLKCVWNLDSACFGNVKELLMFDSIKLPLCEIHTEEHHIIMDLAKVGTDKSIEQMLLETNDERRRKMLIAKLAGLNNKIEIKE